MAKRLGDGINLISPHRHAKALAGIHRDSPPPPQFLLLHSSTRVKHIPHARPSHKGSPLDLQRQWGKPKGKGTGDLGGGLRAVILTKRGAETHL